MYAVEIADGDDRAREGRGERPLAMDDGEGLRRLRDFGHRLRFGRSRAPSLIAGELSDGAQIKSAPPRLKHDPERACRRAGGGCGLSDRIMRPNKYLE